MDQSECSIWCYKNSCKMRQAIILMVLHVSKGRREGAHVRKERWQCVWVRGGGRVHVWARRGGSVCEWGEMCIQLKQNGMGNKQFGNETWYERKDSSYLAVIGSMVHESFSPSVPHLERNSSLLNQPLQTVHMSTLERGEGKREERDGEGSKAV